jgi:hypothetical protein
LNNYIWHPLAKSSRLKPSCPSFQYQANVISKLMVTPYHHYKKSRLFLLGKLIEKVTFCTFDNLTKELLWKVDLNMLVLTSRQDGHVSNWLLVFFTNTLNYILISQFIQLLIWLIIKMIVNMYGF